MYAYFDDVKAFENVATALKSELTDLVQRLDGPKLILAKSERALVRKAVTRRLYRLFDKFIAEFEMGRVDMDSIDQMVRIAQDLKD